jgi:hypothetical protein
MSRICRRHRKKKKKKKNAYRILMGEPEGKETTSKT